MICSLMRIIVLYYQPTQSSGELWATMQAILTISILLLRVITCRLGDTGMELFQSVEETFDRDICSHECMARYIHELSHWNLEQFEKFCYSKEVNKGSLFCNKIYFVLSSVKIGQINFMEKVKLCFCVFSR